MVAEKQIAQIVIVHRVEFVNDYNPIKRRPEQFNCTPKRRYSAKCIRQKWPEPTVIKMPPCHQRQQRRRRRHRPLQG